MGYKHVLNRMLLYLMYGKMAANPRKVAFKNKNSKCLKGNAEVPVESAFIFPICGKHI